MDLVNVKKAKEIESKVFLKDEKLKSYHISNATILPFKTSEERDASYGGVIDEKDMYIPSSAQRIVGADMKLGYVPERLNFSDKTIVWFGAFHNYWGHFLTEMISRCWYFTEHSLKPNEYLGYIMKTDSCNKKIYGSYLEFLTLLGIDENKIIIIEEPTKFKEVIIPELSSYPGEYFAKEYIEIFEKIKKSVTNVGEYKKIYFTRTKSEIARSTQVGERDILKIFKKTIIRLYHLRIILCLSKLHY